MGYTLGLDSKRRCFVMGAVRRYAPRHPRVLDMGCGEGHHSAPIADRARLIGIDPCPGAIAAARANYGDHANYWVAQLRDLPAQPIFDVLICSDLLDGSSDRDAHLRDLRRRLKSGGILVLTLSAGRSDLDSRLTDGGFELVFQQEGILGRLGGFYMVWRRE